MLNIRYSYLFALLLCFLSVSVATAPAKAAVSLSEYASPAITGGESFSYSMGDSVAIEHTLMPPGNRFQAYALADLSRGILRASAASDLLVGNYCCQYGTTFSNAYISDSFSFSGALPSQTASLDFLFSGTIARDPLSPIFPCCFSATHGGEGRLSISIIDPLHREWSANQWLMDNGCWTVSQPCQTGLSIHQVQSLVFPVLTGTYSINLSIQTRAVAGYTADFSHTARFYLDTPQNVIMQSASGALFATAQPVPEPASALLWLLGGCAALVLKGRRRR